MAFYQSDSIATAGKGWIRDPTLPNWTMEFLFEDDEDYLIQYLAKTLSHEPLHLVLFELIDVPEMKEPKLRAQKVFQNDKISLPCLR
jgi:hypothetical protein